METENTRWECSECRGVASFPDPHNPLCPRAAVGKIAMSAAAHHARLLVNRSAYRAAAPELYQTLAELMRLIDLGTQGSEIR